MPAGLTNVVAICAGGDHTLALKRDGTIVGWGDNRKGQAEPPPGLTGVIGLTAADFFSVAQRMDGSLVLWGTTTFTNLPARIDRLQTICAGERILFAVLGDDPPSPFAIPVDPALKQGVFSTASETRRGSTYRLEFSEQLPDGPWALGEPCPGNGDRFTFTHAMARGPAGFYINRRFW